ncbi:MAG: hypothetical protein SFU83_17220 [Meiothermus sp.]|nr:hypothetical protein [Meiothermus sp.]
MEAVAVTLIVLRGALVLLSLVAIGVCLLVGLPLLVREPVAWQQRLFGFTAVLLVVTMFMEITVRTAFMGGVSWLHASYGLITTAVFYAVDGLKENGWLRKGLQKVPERIGPYMFWAGLVGLLLWVRFIQTGLAPRSN